MDDLERYSRQMRFAGFGEEAQRRLRASRVAIVGCGALGSVASSLLVRAGAGYVVVLPEADIDVGPRPGGAQLNIGYREAEGGHEPFAEWGPAAPG